jgi:CRISPR-associated protein Cmr1
LGGICLEKDYDKKRGRFEKDIKNDEIKKRLSKYGTDFWGQIEVLKELGIPLPAIIFGTTGWKSLIEIKKIDFNDENFEEVKDTRIINYKNWFWKKIEYNGELTVAFKVPEEIEETIFFPLLNFMDKYGYWGGSWNVGYGRLKVKEIEINDQLIERTNWQKDKFDFSKFKSSKENLKGNWNGNFNSLIITVNYNDLINKDVDGITEILSTKKVKKIQIEDCNSDIKKAIQKLIEKKAELRKKYKPEVQNENDDKVKLRHEIFGYLKPTEGSKILPYINRLDKNTCEYGLLSIAGILNLYQEPKNEQQ